MSISIANGNGALIYSPKTGRSRRMSAMTLSYCGVEISCEYLTNGCIGPEALVEKLVTVEVNGGDITRLLSDTQIDEICQRIETSWDIEDLDR
jgi:hypothetical protein